MILKNQIAGVVLKVYHQSFAVLRQNNDNSVREQSILDGKGTQLPLNTSKTPLITAIKETGKLTAGTRSIVSKAPGAHAYDTHAHQSSDLH